MLPVDDPKSYIECRVQDICGELNKTFFDTRTGRPKNTKWDCWERYPEGLGSVVKYENKQDGDGIHIEPMKTNDWPFVGKTKLRIGQIDVPLTKDQRRRLYKASIDFYGIWAGYKSIRKMNEAIEALEKLSK